MASKSPNVAALDQIQTECRELLRGAQFRKHGRSYNRSSSEGVVHAITFFLGRYTSSLHGQFNVELGVPLPCLLHIEYGTPHRRTYSSGYCEIRTSLPALRSESNGNWWSLADDPIETGRSVMLELKSVGLPFLLQFQSYEDVIAHYEREGSLPGNNPGRSALAVAVLCHDLGDSDRASDFFDIAKSYNHKGFVEHVNEIQRRCESGP